jgi:subtilisin family serine protease
MSEQRTAAIAAALDDFGCGWTLDVQRREPNRVIQWLWATPVLDDDGANSHELGKDVVARVVATGVELAHPEVVNTHLPNTVEVLDACPFQPETCLGSHVVATGTGVIAGR